MLLSLLEAVVFPVYFAVVQVFTGSRDVFMRELAVKRHVDVMCGQR